MNSERWLARLVLPAALGAVSLVHCGASTRDSYVRKEATGGTAGAAGTAGAGGDMIVAPDTGSPDIVFPDAGDPELEFCQFDFTDDLPPCQDDVGSGVTCDPAVSACRASTDATDGTAYLCLDSSYPSWSKIERTTTPCEDRELVPCSEAEPQRFTHDEIDRILINCLGNENSVTVQLVNGCPTYFRSTAHLPDGVECLRAGLDALRLQCAVDLSCATASHSTLP